MPNRHTPDLDLALAAWNEMAERTAQHTRGPWRIRPEWNPAKQTEVLIDPLDEADGLNNDYAICTCHGSDRCANASLIATAPDLLAALEEMVDMVALWNADVDQRVIVTITAARAAISKARGE